ncbi:unnamed protein product [Cylicocyclus nassatus]|uniref:Methyltransferase FkbM domain-containing protein n=1 Tax=Cylicocyclus nassatus TaxID=53992 RepID=A0AA36HCQ1_CYLNA|nr:unnamed protein product [Cylicocyclus nassatus]
MRLVYVKALLAHVGRSLKVRRAVLSLLVLLSIAIFYHLSSPDYMTSILIQFIAKDVDSRVKIPFHEWKQCVEKNISEYRNDSNKLWWNLCKGVTLCEKHPFMARLEILDFRNSDEIKRHIPSLQEKPSIIVTLGIGKDTAAEKAVRKVLPKGSLFYGADPMQEVNEDLFNKLGTYFPFAVKAKSQNSIANVLFNGSYVTRRVMHIDLAYFLTEIIGHKIYDDLWIDAEGAEYELFPYFYRGGKLDQHGITLCQFNMEVHWPNDARKKLFRDFILKILEDNRYAFFRPVQARHMRLYFLNFSDRHCVSKYIFRKTT